MERSTIPFPSQSLFKGKNSAIFLGCLTLFIGLAIFQDYLFSRLNNTGFYISESLLYNSLWAFILPFALVEGYFLKQLYTKNRSAFFLIAVGFGAVFSLTHLLVFAGYFVTISHFLYKPTHHFSHIFNTAISNQLAFLFLIYATIPFIYQAFLKKKAQSFKPIAANYPENINIRLGTKITAVPTATIQFITTDKPYLAIYTADQMYLSDLSLKAFEALLKPELFLRVHRSSIVNADCIKTLKSRQNGDYDAALKNGKTVRLSRHFRSTWQQLLH